MPGLSATVYRASIIINCLLGSFRPGWDSPVVAIYTVFWLYPPSLAILERPGLGGHWLGVLTRLEKFLLWQFLRLLGLEALLEDVERKYGRGQQL